MFASRTPYPQFFDLQGQPLESGYIYYGEPFQNPVTNPIQVFFDKEGTQPVALPVRTQDGYISRTGTPADIYINQDYSIAVFDKNMQLVYSKQSAIESVGQYQGVLDVTSNAFGAIGNGVADDTLSIQAALDAAGLAGGGVVLLPADKEFLITASLIMNYSGVTLTGAQRYSSVLKPVGNFDAIVVDDGAEGVNIENMRISGAGMTGGNVFNIADGARTNINNILGASVWNIGLAQKFNLLEFTNLWFFGCRGEHAFKLSGTPSLRGDVVEFNNVTASASSSVTYANRMVGLIWEGNIHTVTTHGLRFVVPSMGILIRSAGGGSFPAQQPAFMFAHDIEVDYPYYESLKIDNCYSVKIVNFYGSNSVTASAVTINTGAKSGSIANGFFHGNNKEGMVIDGDDWQITGTESSLNSLPIGNLAKYAGIRIGANANRINFAGCHSGDVDGSGATQSYGLLIEAGATNITWNGYLGGNLYYPYKDNTTSNANVSISAQGGAVTIDNNLAYGVVDGFGAEASPTIASGVITAVTVTNQGYSFTSAPQVFAFDPNGTGAGATFAATLTGDKVTSISVVTGGASYSADTVIYFRPLNNSVTLRPYSNASANLILRARAKGNGTVDLGNDGGTGLLVFAESNSKNYLTAKGNIAGGAPQIFCAGTDTNIDLSLLPKGTGKIQLSTPYVNTPSTITGYIEIKDNSGVIRKLAVIS